MKYLLKFREVNCQEGCPIDILVLEVPDTKEIHWLKLVLERCCQTMQGGSDPTVWSHRCLYVASCIFPHTHLEFRFDRQLRTIDPLQKQLQD